MMRTVSYGTLSITYSVKRANRATIAIEVLPDSSVVIVAPESATDQLIHSKVEKRASWITKQMRFFSNARRTARIREWVSGESIYYLGRQYRLRVTEGDPAVRLSGKFLRVSVSKKRNAEEVEQLVNSWMIAQAKRVFPKRFDLYSSILAKENIKMNRLMIRKIQKRWGSCTKKGNIVLNTNLIHAPVNCIDYVIIHEICHLKHHHHGPKFWTLLSKYCPDWGKVKLKLEQFNF